MKRLFFCLLFLGFLAFEAHAFCGIFVANADSKLFNESSQVILVRDGDFSVVIMSNDYKGDAAEFAMIVPVPTVLKEEDIQLADANLFSKFDRYSAPRMTMYYDKSPCPRNMYKSRKRFRTVAFAGGFSSGSYSPVDRGPSSYGVQIEAKYTVGEYDILILSANESNGLKRWLTDNEYKLPENAGEVLDPYIKGGMKFFVAKVNLERMSPGHVQSLKPLKIQYRHDKFMLPIRLGMANSNGTQDLIIYALTRKGRVECTNYRTVKMPTNKNIPEFVRAKFGPFYKDTYDRQYEEEHKTAVFLEYAWDCSQMAPVKCDPCNGQPPMIADLQAAGVPWANDKNEKTFFTRLHVRYDRKNFPQDLQFQVTPNTTKYQVRYYMKRPNSNTDCDKAQDYLKEVVQRRRHELEVMNELAGWEIGEHYASYVGPYEEKLSTSGTRRQHGSVIFNFDTGYEPEPQEANKAAFNNDQGQTIILQIMGYGALLLVLLAAIRKLFGITSKTHK